MARPDTAEGFAMLPLDLLCALLAADLPNREMVVLAEVLIQTHGPAKRPTVHLDPATIEHYTGLHRNNVRRAITDLLARGLLRRDPDDGALWFVEDFEAWRIKGRALADRLDGGLVRFARAAVARFGKPIKTSKKDPIQPDPNPPASPIQRDCEPTCLPNPVGLGSGAPPQSNGIVRTIGTRASEDQRDSRQDKIQDTHTPDAGGRGGGEDHSPLCHEGPDGVRRPIPPQVQNDPAEVERVAAVAEALFPGRHFGGHVSRYAVLYPVAWIERAIVDAGGWREPLRTFSPIVNKLTGWARHGGPPPDEPPPLRVVATGTTGPVAVPPSLATLRRRELSESIRRVYGKPQE